MLEYSLIKQHRPRFNVRLRRRQELPVPRRHAGRRVAAADGDAGRQAQGRALLRPVRPRLRHPRDARPAAAHVPHPHLLGQQVRPPPAARAARACCSTSRSAAGPCVGEIDKPSATTSWCDELLEFLDGDTDDDRQAARDARCARPPTSSSSSGRPGCATGSTRVRKAIEKQQMVADRDEDLDVIGIADDELEAAVQVFYVRRGRVVGRKGFVVDKVEDLTPARARRATCSRASTTTSRRSACPSRCSCPCEPDDPDLYERWLDRAARVERSTIRVPQRGDKRDAAGDGHPQRQGGVHPPPAAAGRPTTTAGPRRSTSCRTHLGLPEAPLRIECYDMSHIQGTRLRRLDGGDRGRPARRRASTAGSRSRSVPGNDDFAAMEEVLTRRLTAYLAERRQAGRRARRQVRLPAAAAAGRRRQGPARRGRAGARGARPRRRDPRGRRWPSGSRRSTCPARPIRSASPASPRRSTCCSASATRPTASPSRTTASCAASA